MRILNLALTALLLTASAACGEKSQPSGTSLPKENPPMPANQEPPTTAKIETATLGAGCFWCVEAVYQELKGVISVESGYAGGPGANPTYKEVCSGRTGHAEVCQIKFDPSVLSFKDVLQVFWKTHDPT